MGSQSQYLKVPCKAPGCRWKFLVEAILLDQGRLTRRCRCGALHAWDGRVWSLVVPVKAETPPTPPAKARGYAE